MFVTPYETSLGSQFKNLKPIIFALNQAHFSDDLYKLKGYPQIVAVVKGDLALEAIPPFVHPLVINESQTQRPDYKSTIAVDLRPFSNRILVDRENKTVEVMDDGPAGILVKQAILQIIWQQSQRRVADDVTDLPMTVFSRWISETMARKFNLPPLVQMDVAVLAAWWYYCQALSADRVKDLEEIRYNVAPRITRSVRTTTMNRVQELLANVGVLTNISSFIEELHKLGNLRLNEMNLTAFYTAITGSWFGGPNVREVVQIATEYPPYFVALVHSAVNEKMYNKTPLATIVLQAKKDQLNGFNMAIKLLLESAGG